MYINIYKGLAGLLLIKTKRNNIQCREIKKCVLNNNLFY